MWQDVLLRVTALCILFVSIDCITAPGTGPNSAVSKIAACTVQNSKGFTLCSFRPEPGTGGASGEG